MAYSELSADGVPLQPKAVAFRTYEGPGEDRVAAALKAAREDA